MQVVYEATKLFMAVGNEQGTFVLIEQPWYHC